MSINVKLVIQTIVRPFYRQYAALFAFVLFILFFAVGRANQVGMLEYHAALMKGILLSRSFLVLVLIAWMLYAMKCQQFVTRTIRAREYRFLFQLVHLNAGRIFGLMLLAHSLLFLPVLLYALMLIWIGFYQHLPGPAFSIMVYIPLICVGGATRSLYLLRHPGAWDLFERLKMPALNRRIPYWIFLVRFVLAERKLLFAGIKLYSAGTLYFMLSKADFIDRTDLQLVYLFYSFGLLGHGVLVHQVRTMEDQRLGFYRSLPVSLIKRWIQYALLYFLFFIPEILIIVRNASVFPRVGGVFIMGFFGYSMLLLLNSLLFIRHYKMTDYLKFVTGIFFLVYIAVLTGMVAQFALAVFLLGGIAFLSRYYQYERWEQNME